jgi:hypothetical protein
VHYIIINSHDVFAFESSLFLTWKFGVVHALGVMSNVSLLVTQILIDLFMTFLIGQNIKIMTNSKKWLYNIMYQGLKQKQIDMRFLLSSPSCRLVVLYIDMFI